MSCLLRACVYVCLFSHKWTQNFVPTDNMIDNNAAEPTDNVANDNAGYLDDSRPLRTTLNSITSSKISSARQHPMTSANTPSTPDQNSVTSTSDTQFSSVVRTR